jgi:hypothetical protein
VQDLVCQQTVTYLMNMPSVASDQERNIIQLKVLNQYDLKEPYSCGFFTLYNTLLLSQAFQSSTFEQAQVFIDQLNNANSYMQYSKTLLQLLNQKWRISNLVERRGLYLNELRYLVQYDFGLNKIRKPQQQLAELTPYIAYSIAGQHPPEYYFDCNNDIKQYALLVNDFRNELYGCRLFIIRNIYHYYTIAIVKYAGNQIVFLADSLNDPNLLVRDRRIHDFFLFE